MSRSSPLRTHNSITVGILGEIGDRLSLSMSNFLDLNFFFVAQADDRDA